MSKRPGTSFWPEPNALRRLSGQFEFRHKPSHGAGNIFPRASFGMPIPVSFHRDDRRDPKPSSILPDGPPDGPKRLASPIIIKPVALADSKFAAIAALLPGAREVLKQKIRIEHAWPDKAPIHSVSNSFEIWPSDAGARCAAKAKISPMSGLDADNPLDAFLKFFDP